jgi:hypothetical protein
MTIKNLMAAVGLLFLFGACENDLVEGFGKGGKVEIFLSTNITNYHAGGDVTRGAGLKEAESRTIYINDSIYLQTTLVPDSDEELRAAAFKEGQKLCFAAFKADGSGQVGSTAVYTYSGGKWTSSNPLGVTPDNSTVYRFVAWSYFDETGTPPTDGSSIDPSHDLVWGMSANTKIEDETEAKRTVSISMTHKFARVKVVVKSGIPTVDIDALSGVSIEGGQLATLTPFDGDINWSGTANQGVADPFTVNSTTERESGYRTVKPVAAGDLKVKVGSVKISAVVAPFTNQTVAFTPALSAGTSYTLVVDVKRCVWARSNIYWDSSKLTFVPAGNDLSKQGYQGVYFKWGSLVGISPAGSDANTYSTSTLVYKPNAVATGTYATWDAIPYENSSSATVVGSPNIGTFKGDICTHINSGYRLPVNGEFGTSSGWYQQGWVEYENADFSPVTTDKDDGTYDFIANNKSCAKNTVLGDVIFPASGYRFDSSKLTRVGTCGVYQIGSAYSATENYYMYFSYLFLYTSSTSGSRSYAYTVRCVQN